MLLKTPAFGMFELESLKKVLQLHLLDNIIKLIVTAEFPTFLDLADFLYPFQPVFQIGFPAETKGLMDNIPLGKVESW